MINNRLNLIGKKKVRTIVIIIGIIFTFYLIKEFIATYNLHNKIVLKEYVYKDDHFSINFPNDPKITDLNIETSAGKLAGKYYQYEKNDFTFMIAYMNLPEVLANASGDYGLTDVLINAFLGSNNDTEVIEKLKISKDNYPGYKVTLRVKNTITCNQYFYMIKNKFFILSAFDFKMSQGDSKEIIENFYQSFKVID